jgi:hypothetical protein
LHRQIEAIRSQTVAPEEVVVWNNGEALGEYEGVTIVNAGKNWGVWPRFAFAQFLAGDYVAVFDDDTIPGRKWFENCLTVMKTATGDAVLGTCGLTFDGGERAKPRCWGWKNPMPDAVRVDIVGHAWFFPKWLSREYAGKIPIDRFDTAGEDYFMSVVAQESMTGTYCPPHPPDDRELWGSLYGMELGLDDVALCRMSEEAVKKDAVHRRYIQQGWRPLDMPSEEFHVAIRCPFHPTPFHPVIRQEP